MAKQASKAKESVTSQYRKAKKDEMPKKREEGWDSYLQGDKCMYQLSSTESAKRVAIREQCVSFLNQLAKVRDSRGDRASEENVAKIENQLSLPLKPQNCSVTSQQKRCYKLDTVTKTKNGHCSGKKNMKLSKVSRSLPTAKTTRRSCFNKEDQTFRSLVKAAIDDDESVIVARQALESVRRRLKLCKHTAMETSSEASRVSRLNPTKTLKASNEKSYLITKSTPSSCLKCCDDEETIRSSVIASIDDNESVIAARKALEAIRNHFKLGTVTNLNEDLSTSYSMAHFSHNTIKDAVWSRSNEDQSILSDVTKSVHEVDSVIAARAALEQARSQLDVLGLLSSTANRDWSWVGSSMAAFGEADTPEISLEYCSRKGPELPDAIAFDSLSLHPSTCKPQCGAEKDLSEAQHFDDQGDMDIHSLQSDNLCSAPHPPLFDQLASTDVMEKTLAIKRKIQSSHSLSNHDGASDTGFADNQYANPLGAETSPSIMEIGDANVDNELWNSLVSWDGRGTLLHGDDGIWYHSAHATPCYVDTRSIQAASPCPSFTPSKIEKCLSSPCMEVNVSQVTLSRNQTDLPYQLNTSSASGNNPMKSKSETPMISILNGSKEDWMASPSQSTILYATSSAFLPENSEATPTITICEGSTEDWSLSI